MVKYNVNIKLCLNLAIIEIKYFGRYCFIAKPKEKLKLSTPF
jgi:hypothetical protein